MGVWESLSDGSIIWAATGVCEAPVDDSPLRTASCWAGSRAISNGHTCQPCMTRFRWMPAMYDRGTHPDWLFPRTWSCSLSEYVSSVVPHNSDFYTYNLCMYL